MKIKYIFVFLIIFLFSCSRIDKNIPAYKYEIYPKTNIENAQPFYREGINGKAILFIHGWTGSPSHFRELATIMNQKGWTVYSILLTGHGTNLYDMEKATYKDWINDAEEGYKKLKEKYNDITVIGLSMGGSLALYLAGKYEVKNVICVAPALIPNNKMAYLVPVLRPFIARFRFRPDRIVKEGEATEYFHDYLGSPTKTVPDMVKIGNMAKKSLKNISCPVFIIQSEKDEAVDKRVPEIIMKNVSSTKKRVLWLKRSRHISTTDVERFTIYEEIEKFIE